MIYFIQRGWEDGPIKIGYTANLRQRYQSLRSRQVRHWLLSAIEGDRKLEQRLHGQFWRDRLDGEWFKPSKRLLRFIDTLPCPSGASATMRCGVCIRLSPNRQVSTGSVRNYMLRAKRRKAR